MSYKHQLWWTGKLSLSQGHYKNLSSFYKSLLSLGGLIWMNFSATPDFLPFPNLSCKAHKGGSTGKMLLAAQQKAHGSCSDGLPFCLGQSYSSNPPTPVMCVTVIPVSPESFHNLPSQLVQPHGSKGRALPPTSTSLWGSPVCHPEAAGDKSLLSLAKSVSQRWNSFLLQLLEEKVNCSCCSCCSTPHGEA